MPNTKYDYLENETLQNIQILLEEKDIRISILLEASKEAKYALEKEGYKEPDGVIYLLNNAIKQVESK